MMKDQKGLSTVAIILIIIAVVVAILLIIAFTGPEVIDESLNDIIDTEPDFELEPEVDEPEVEEDGNDEEYEM